MFRKSPGGGGARVESLRLDSGNSHPMNRVFFPGSVDYEGPMSRDFNSGRALSSHSLAVWRAALEPHIGRADNVLDLGSGTGRFAVLIAEWFGATVIGVEPAGGMREVAATSGRHAKVFTLLGEPSSFRFERCR